MGEIIMITGGCRSGKSGYAQRLAENTGEKRLFVATAPVMDDEMRKRVDLHIDARRGRGWDTAEETLDIASCLRRAGNYDVIVCDCLTLWVSNRQHKAFQDGISLEEKEISRAVRKVCGAARKISGRVIFVTNEVGNGIVPMDEISRRFRDLMGRCNQEMAAFADSVFMLVSGLAIQIKGEENENHQ